MKPGINWNWIVAAVSIGATVLVLIFLYAPGGNWKWALLTAAIVAVVVASMNPDIRLLQLGTACVATGIGGIALAVLFRLSIQFPDGTETGVSVETGGNTDAFVFPVLIIIGLCAVSWHIQLQRQDNAAAEHDGLTYVILTDMVRLMPDSTDSARLQFVIELSVSKSTQKQIRIVRAEVEGALDAHASVDHGDGYFADNVVRSKTGSRVNVIGHFSKADVPSPPFVRRLELIDHQGRRSSEIKVKFDNS